VDGHLDTSVVEVSVSDTGPGVPRDELERIFDRFYRAERSRHRDEGGGSGLGLAIARGLVEAHHGRIWAEISPLGGISVRMSLPVQGRG
jgi:signal transduction histidine kinase